MPFIGRMCSLGGMSGSVWFPGFKEYICSRELKRRPDCIYFSLRGQGNQDPQKETRTRNSVLKKVQENTEEIRNFY